MKNKYGILMSQSIPHPQKRVSEQPLDVMPEHRIHINCRKIMKYEASSPYNLQKNRIIQQFIQKSSIWYRVQSSIKQILKYFDVILLLEMHRANIKWCQFEWRIYLGKLRRNNADFGMQFISNGLKILSNGLKIITVSLKLALSLSRSSCDSKTTQNGMLSMHANQVY